MASFVEFWTDLVQPLLTNLLTGMTETITWMFKSTTGSLDNWPVTIMFATMFVIFIIKTLRKLTTGI